HGINRSDVVHFQMSDLKKQGIANTKADVTTDNQSFAIKNVGSVPRGQKEKNDRQELGQADESQIERAACNFVNLPADCDRLHLKRRNQEKTSDCKQREIRIPESHQAGVRMRFGHVLLMCHRERRWYTR